MQQIYEDGENTSGVCHVMDEQGGVTAQQVDNLYLDCNGIVHVRVTEEE
jgi:5'-3' exonuclease